MYKSVLPRDSTTPLVGYNARGKERSGKIKNAIIILLLVELEHHLTNCNSQYGVVLGYLYVNLVLFMTI
jgi:hypothetical protein